MKYIPVAERTRTFIVDLDGTIFRQGDRWPGIKIEDPRAALLPGVKDKLAEWHMRGDFVMVVTARPEAYREMTEGQLRVAGLMYHKLVMGLPTGPRVLINDKKPEEETPTALALNLSRDQGMEGIQL